MQIGDLVTRINGQPVANWTLPRYEQLVAAGGAITFTFLNGRTETDEKIPVLELVP